MNRCETSLNLTFRPYSNKLSQMKKVTILHTFLQNHTKKEILVAGFYLFFLLIITLAMFLDFLIGNRKDAAIELVFIVVTLLSLLYNRYVKNIDIALNSIVLIATILTYVLLISNDFQMAIFHIIMPLAFFLLYDLKRSLLYFWIHQMIVTALYIYAYYHYGSAAFAYSASDIVAIIMASLIILFIGIFYHLGVENSYRQLERSNAHNSVLLKEIHHRVKNNLNIIASILGLQMMNIKKGVAKDAYTVLKENQLRIQAIAMIHEALYRSDYLDSIDFTKYTRALTELINQAYGKEIYVDISSDRHCFAIETMFRLGVILNELFTNSIKYAFTGDESKDQVTIALHREDHRYRLVYHERDHHHIDIDTIKNSRTLGMKLIHLTLQEMHGTMDISNDNGLKVVIQFVSEEIM